MIVKENVEIPLADMRTLLKPYKQEFMRYISTYRSSVYDKVFVSKCQTDVSYILGHLKTHVRFAKPNRVIDTLNERLGAFKKVEKFNKRISTITICPFCGESRVSKSLRRTDETEKRFKNQFVKKRFYIRRVIKFRTCLPIDLRICPGTRLTCKVCQKGVPAEREANNKFLKEWITLNGSDYKNGCISLGGAIIEFRLKKRDLVKRLKSAGYVMTAEGRARVQSAALQGITPEEWVEYVSYKPYCKKFDTACRESIRENWDRKCAVCGTGELMNGARLSVHHVTKNKREGCDGSKLKLIPLCKSCHGSAHTEPLESRLKFLFE